MSPCAEERTSVPMSALEPLGASTPLARPLTNGHGAADPRAPSSDALNGNVNVNVNIVSESTNSMDVLSGGESDAGDTLNRRNNNSISSTLTSTLREAGEAGEAPRRRAGRDITYFIADELLMTERTYKRDLELVTVACSTRVSGMVEAGADVVAALARVCLALEPLALPTGALLARLDKMLLAPHHADDSEPEYKNIAELLYDYLSSTYDAYSSYCERVGTAVGVVESVRRHSACAERELAALDAAAPLPLAALLLRPLHRTLHLHRLAAELAEAVGSSAALKALELSRHAARAATEQLQHVENHAMLCQLQRDIVGYDKLLVADREFVRLGCVYKHSTRGLQQRMLFLFNDVLVVASKSGSSQFRAHAALPLHSLEVKPTELPHSFTLTGEDAYLLFSASNEHEFAGWLHSLELAIDHARDNVVEVDTELTPYEQETGPGGSACGAAGGGGGGGALAHVCWHRATSLSRHRLHLALRTQLSGCLLRKFKNSIGWQKLWVVFAAFTLFFYKSWQDESPLASLPLLGYSVSAPTESDAIHKDFVFKLQFKNHIYFFRANSQYTYNRWTEVLQTAMVRSDHN